MGNISLEVQVDVNIICGHTLNNQVHLLCQLGAYLTIMPGGKRVYVTCIVTAPQTVCHTEICMFSDGDAENLYGYSNLLYLSLF